MSYDSLRRGRHSLHHQVYCITTVTRGRHPWFTDITAARLLVRELRRLHEQGDVSSLAWVVMPDQRIFAGLRGILLPTCCERAWFGILATIPIGTASG